MHWPHVYVAVALTTLATLVLELALTRIFSVVFYYHMAFLAISVALFGLGAGGVCSYLVSGWKTNLWVKLGRLSAANSLLVVLALAVILAQMDQSSQWALALVYFTTSLPFFVSGIILSLAISETVERVDRVYFFDLMGAAGGCIVLIGLLNNLSGPGTVLAVGVLFAAAGAVWHSMGGSIRGRAACVALSLALVAFIVYNGANNLLNVRYAKGQKLHGETFVKWNVFSRIALAPEKDSGIPMIFIDADASTGIANFDYEHLSERDRHDLLEQGPSLPYDLRPGAKTLIIGPGGGWDVARALASGSHDVTGVEINPIIATTIMREKFPALSRNLYLRPDVHIEVADGRSFVRRSSEKYQVLQATLVDTWASTAAGAFALSESNLYTTEAFVDYLSHLTPDGVVAFTRWGFDPPRESLRLVGLAMEALGTLGQHEPWRNVIVAREGSVKGFGARDTVLISRQPFSASDVDRTRAVLAAGNMQGVYLPGMPRHNRPGHEFADLLLSPNPGEYERNYQFDISPVSDNRPFFFYTVQPRDIQEFVRNASHDTADYKINRAVPLLFSLMAISLVATLVVLALPPVLLGDRLPRHKGVTAFLVFFLCIGAGYILIEVALIQKFVLFLGHPTYALTVVIFSLLVSSGLGSYFSRRWLTRGRTSLLRALALIAILVGLVALATSSLLTVLVGLPMPLKMLLTVALLAPAGFVMGMPFPTGLRLLEQWHKPSLRWAWSLNSAASVLGSVGALVCAIYLGLLETLLVGGGLYLVALAAVAATRGLEPAHASSSPVGKATTPVS